MQGTPYIYQGEELGMTNVRFEDISQYRDIEIFNMYKERMQQGYSKSEIWESIYAKGRDNARTPMQWNGSTHGGFTEGTPWIGVNPNYRQINAKAERENPNSVYHYYRRLIQLRKEYPVFVEGKFELLLEEDEQIFAYTRTNESCEMLVCANFSGQNVNCELLSEWRQAKQLIHNVQGKLGEELKPYEAVICIREK